MIQPIEVGPCDGGPSVNAQVSPYIGHGVPRPDDRLVEPAPNPRVPDLQDTLAEKDSWFQYPRLSVP